MFQFRSGRLAAVLALSVAPASALAGLSVGQSVVSYVPGTAPAGYQVEAAALGTPQADAGGGSILTPFNAAWAPERIVAIGAGGSLTIEMSPPLATTGHTLGVHAGVGLIDVAWPEGNTGAVAMPFTNPRISQVLVSDGATWVDLGQVTFDIPSNFYAAGVSSPGYTTTHGTVEADWSQPFQGALADFNQKDWAGVLSLLDGSGGGTWLDLSGTGLDAVRYVQFVVPAGQTDAMFVDALVGVAIPEPAALSLLGGAALLLIRRRSIAA